MENVALFGQWVLSMVEELGFVVCERICSEWRRVTTLVSGVLTWMGLRRDYMNPNFLIRAPQKTLPQPTAMVFPVAEPLKKATAVEERPTAPVFLIATATASHGVADTEVKDPEYGAVTTEYPMPEFTAPTIPHRIIR